MTRKILMIAVAFVFAFTACNSDSETEEVVSNAPGDGYLVDDDLLTEMPTYSGNAAGQSEKIERAFQDAPPMIPHDVSAFLPITIKNNMCLTCHMPEVAVLVKSVPLPESHLTSYRPEVKKKWALYVVTNNEGVTQKDLGGKLSNAVFNCTQCHVPQANVTVDIKNVFEAVFKTEEGRTKSSLTEDYTEGVQ